MTTLSKPVTPEDHIMGAKSAAEYTLVEYGDLQCPDTAIAETELTELTERLQGRLRIVYRHFPLDIHYRAYFAAEATEAAGAQNKFWEMRQMILENQDHLDRETIIRYASDLKLNMARFESDLDTHAQAKRLTSDIQSGTDSGVESTPTFFLNDEMLDPGLDLFEVFDSLEESDEDEDEDDEI